MYYENHHIIPRCLNGSDEKENKVLLTAREHYVCHKLLTYIYKGNKKIIWALHRMTFNKNSERRLSSKEYEYSRILLINLLSGKPGHIAWNKGKQNVQIYSEERNKIVSEKTKEAMHTQEVWEKFIKNNKKDEKCREKIRAKNKISCAGSKNGMFGKHHSKQSKEKMRLAAKNRKPQ